MIQRPTLVHAVRGALQRAPIVAILGPRQCGKSTLARSLCDELSGTFFDVEDPQTAGLFDNAMSVLERLRGVVFIDEFQLRPALLGALRVLADRPDMPYRFVILGSASPDLVKGSSQTLAGRVAFVDMSGFRLDEVGPDRWPLLWQRGGFPRHFLAGSDADSFSLREDFIRTFLERDLPQLGINLPALTMRRFWTMLAHTHGQFWNGSEIGSSLGVSHHTSRRYLDLLSGAFVVRQLQPWFANTGKRLVKSPKVYVRDTGLLHALLGLSDETAVLSHPKLGASFEGFCVEQILSIAGERDAYFWATQGRAELDLLLVRGGRHVGFEFKWGDSPTITKSMRIALEDLSLTKLYLVHGGARRLELDDRIELIGVSDLPTLLAGVSDVQR